MELKFSSDIRKFKTKDVGNFSFKEAGFIALGCVTAIGMWWLQKNVMHIEPNVGLCIPIPAIILAFGFVKPFGMTFYQFIRTVVMEWVIEPKVYIWESDVEFDLDEMKLSEDEKQLYLLSDENISTPLTKKELKELEKHII